VEIRWRWSVGSPRSDYQLWELICHASLTRLSKLQASSSCICKRNPAARLPGAAAQHLPRLPHIGT
jgi:hypothetical protein